MKTIKLSILSLTVLALAACGSSSSVITSYTSRSNNIENVNISATKTIVDVTPDFSRRITAQSQPCLTIEDAKEEAKYNAIIDNKIDIVVDPIYKIEMRNGRYTAYLTGFAGRYANPRTNLGEIQLLENISKDNIEKYLLLKADPQIVKYIYPQQECGGVVINHNAKPQKEVAPAVVSKPAKK